MQTKMQISIVECDLKYVANAGLHPTLKASDALHKSSFGSEQHELGNFLSSFAQSSDRSKPQHCSCKRFCLIFTIWTKIEFCVNFRE